MEQESYGGAVVLSRPRGVVAMLSEDGSTATIVAPVDLTSPVWASLLEELHRAGLPDGVDVVEEWPTEPEYEHSPWVTVFA